MSFPVANICKCGATLRADACEVDGVTCVCGRRYEFEWDAMEVDGVEEDFVLWNEVGQEL